MRILAIDPGVTGAIAAINPDGSFIDVVDLQCSEAGTLKWIKGSYLRSIVFTLRGADQCIAVVERIQVMNKPGVSKGKAGGFSQGMTLGSILAVLECLSVPIQLAQPAKWKRDLGLTNPDATDTERKHASLELARRLFPDAPLDLVKHHNRAEALLLAEWRRRSGAFTVRIAA